MPKLPTLSPRKRRELIQAQADAKAFQKAAGAMGALAGQLGMAPGVAPGSSWYNTGNMQMLRSAAVQALQAQFKQPTAEVETALAEQGLSWSPPFGPGEPLHPYLGYRTPARTRDYTVGENVQITPRFGRISFATLKGIYGSYDVAQVCVRHLINDVRSLDTSWVPADGVKADVTEDVEKAREFFMLPDRRRPFRAWLAAWLQDILRWDAGCLYIRRNLAGDPIGLEVVDGTTMIPLTDFYGRLPMDEDDATVDPYNDPLEGEVIPAYTQIIQGMPFEWLTADDVIYQPLNPVPESQYGLAPLESILLTANTDIRFQWHFLNYFTEGSLPAGFMEAPPDMSDAAQIQQWQEIWDEIMLGDQSKLRQIRWVPNGSKFTAAKNEDFNEAFPEYLMRRTCASYGVTPADLGFVQDVNRATGDTQIDVQFRVGTLPVIRHVEDVISLFVQRELGLKVRLQIDDGREVEDRVATAQAHSIYIQAGVESPDEVRDELGLQTDKTQAVGRFIQTRQGVVPLEGLLSQTKVPIDPETFAPAGKVEYEPPAPVPGQPGEPGQGAGAAGGQGGGSESTAGSETTAGSTPAGQKPGLPGGKDAANTSTTPAAAKSFDVLAVWKAADGSLRFNVQHEDGLTEYGLRDLPAEKEATAGVTAATGVQGADVVHRDDDEDDDEERDDLATKQALRRWRDNSRNRLRKGRAPRPFTDPDLPPELHDLIWGALKTARSREEVDAAFEAAAGKAEARKAGAEDWHRNSDAIVAHYEPLIIALLARLVPKGKLERAARENQPAQKAVIERPKAAGGEDDDGGLAEMLRQALLDMLGSFVDGNVVDQLEELLRSLYGDTALQAVYHATRVTGIGLPDWVNDLKLPDDYWSAWTPGWGEAAAKVAGPGLQRLLGDANVQIRGMVDTSLERLAGALAEGLAAGDPVGKVAQAAVDAGANPARAEMIANTELARAMTVTSMDTYRANAVEEIAWLAEATACLLCQANEDASPIGIDEDWPNGSVPVHPRCRCAVIPHIDWGAPP